MSEYYALGKCDHCGQKFTIECQKGLYDVILNLNKNGKSIDVQKFFHDCNGDRSFLAVSQVIGYGKMTVSPADGVQHE